MNLFKKTSSRWVRYDKYEWREDDRGRLYITPAEKAKPELYNPLMEKDLNCRIQMHDFDTIQNMLFIVIE